ncbi:MAG: hypothetical protein KAS52_02375 [Candidatus Heimdallarchaeota archaeon]|nr:hypothetical protein [Candidatus Heimdallarchaeota archaeon]
MMRVDNNDDNNTSTRFEQIDITDGYQTAIRRISDETGVVISNKVKEKIYPEGVKKITYSPQTESIYYYNDNLSVSEHKLKWEIFEDRGAIIETKLIENLNEIDEIKLDLDKITQEEKQIEYMPIDEIIEKISEFVKTYGEKAFRYRVDLEQNEKCKAFRFYRVNHTEEITLFSSDKHLVLRRFENDDKVHQKNVRSMNRTIVCWYYEGLLRMRRLDEKQKKYLRKIEG